MAIQGSVFTQPTVTSLTDTAETVTFPDANLTVVKIWTTATYVSIPIDSSRKAYFPKSGGDVATSPNPHAIGTGRNTNFQVSGTVLNYNIFSVATTPITVWYYGTPLTGSRPLSAYAAVVTNSTLTSGSGTGTFTFPSGNLRLTGITAALGEAAASTVIEIQWATESGKLFTAMIGENIVTESGDSMDILPLDLPISQTLAYTLALGVGSDKITAFAFYK